MNLKTILGLLARHFLGALGAGLVTKGVVSADEATVLVNAGTEIVVGGVLSAGAVAWSYAQKKNWLRDAR